jgi:hypothetical protein
MHFTLLIRARATSSKQLFDEEFKNVSLGEEEEENDQEEGEQINHDPTIVAIMIEVRTKQNY